MKRRTVDIGGDLLEITPLGAGNEVGRSCVLCRFKGKTIMFDCGIHPAFTGMQSLPWFDTIEDSSQVDLILVTHFHLDHCAALPYFVEHTGFKGRVYMTHPTAAIGELVLKDFCNMSGRDAEEPLYNEEDLKKTWEKVERLDYHQQIEYNGINFWCYNAGHVLGAAMFVVEIAGIRILYTGDFSRQEDRHLMGAETPQVPIDVLIVESTYGVQNHKPREEREGLFTGWVDEIVKGGGKCLIPVFALGRAQELLLILEEHWRSHPELHEIGVWYAGKLTQKCMSIYQRYTNMMNTRIRREFTAFSNPFNFEHVKYLETDAFDNAKTGVVMASPGTLQNGASRDIFEKICGDPRSGVIIPGFCVEGSLAKRLMGDPKTVQSTTGRELMRKCSIKNISFSAHSDCSQTTQFVDTVKPPNVILVHGESEGMGRLKQHLSQAFKQRNICVFMPKNCQAVKLPFHPDRTKVLVVGELAAQPPSQQRRIGGILVGKDFSYRMMDAKDLGTYTQLKTNKVKINQKIPYHYSLSVLSFCIGQIYDDIVEEPSKLVFYDSKVEVCQEEPGSLNIRWPSSPVMDMVVDSVVSIALRIESNPLSIKDIEDQIAIKHESRALLVEQKALYILQRHFGKAEKVDSGITVTADNKVAKLLLPSFNVECEDEKLKERVEALATELCETLMPVVSETKPAITVSTPVAPMEEDEHKEQSAADLLVVKKEEEPGSPIKEEAQ